MIAALVEATPAEIVAARLELGKEICRLRGRLAEVDLGAEYNRLSGELAVALNHEKALLGGHRTAILGAWAIEAGKMEASADLLLSEAAEREKRTNALLADLLQLEEVVYVPGPPVRRMYGGRPAMAPEPQIPRSQQMRDKAARLRADAAQLRARQPIDAGELLAADVNGIIAGLATLDPARIPPPISELISGAERALEEGRARMARRIINGVLGDRRPIAVKIVWKAGRIEYCRPELPEL